MNFKLLALILLIVGGLVHLLPGHLTGYISGTLITLGPVTVTIQKIVGALSVAVAAILFTNKECK